MLINKLLSRLLCLFFVLFVSVNPEAYQAYHKDKAYQCYGTTGLNYLRFKLKFYSMLTRRYFKPPKRVISFKVRCFLTIYISIPTRNVIHLREDSNSFIGII